MICAASGHTEDMRLPRSTGAVSGLLIVLLGLWGALIPLVGPYFDFGFSPDKTWHYTSDRLWLTIVPGAVAVIAGLMLIRSATRVRGALAGWLAMLAGAWFAVGPAISLTWEGRGRGPIGAPLGGSWRQAAELLGCFHGLGAVIVALAAIATGRFLSRPRIAEDAAMVAGAPVGAAAATAETDRGERRRWPFSRRRRAARADGAGDGDGAGSATR